MNMMGGMVKITVLNDKADGMNMLFDAMGQKIWVEQSAEEIRLERSSAEEMDITYDKSDTKEIAGFSCYKMTAVIEGDNGDMTVQAYITEDIEIDAQIMQGVDMTQFAGFPLEYTFKGGPMTMTITTKEFKKSVDPSVFDIVTGGFQKITMSEFKDMMAGFGM